MSSDSQPERSSEPTLEQRMHMTDSFGKFLHNGSIVMLVAAPVLIALPPRKLDLYTFSLCGAWLASANRLTKERTGAGLFYQLPGAQMPSYAVEYQQRMRSLSPASRLLDDDVSKRDSIQDTLEKRDRFFATAPQQSLPPASSVSEALKGKEDDWKAQRLAEEQRKLDEGEGYGGMIMDQIWEVWNQGQKFAEEIKEKDEEVVKHRKEAEEQRKAGADRKAHFVLGHATEKIDARELDRRRQLEFPPIGKGDWER